MVGEMIKPILKHTITPMIEKGNPADFLKNLQPYLEAGKINPDTGEAYFNWPPQVTGKLWLDVNPFDEAHPIKIRTVGTNILVYPMSPDDIKAFILTLVSNSLQEPAADDIVKQIPQG